MIKLRPSIEAINLSQGKKIIYSSISNGVCKIVINSNAYLFSECLNSVVKNTIRFRGCRKEYKISNILEWDRKYMSSLG